MKRSMLDLIFALQTNKIRRQWHPTWRRWRNLHTTCAVEGGLKKWPCMALEIHLIVINWMSESHAEPMGA
jgi:hypothetical protein